MSLFIGAIIWASHDESKSRARAKDSVTSEGSSLWSGTRLLQWKRSSKGAYLNNAWNWPDMYNHYSGPRLILENNTFFYERKINVSMSVP